MVGFAHAKDMLEFIKPRDYERALKHYLTSSMESELWRWVQYNRNFRDTYIRKLVEEGGKDSRSIDKRKEILAKDYFKVKPELYWEFLTEKRILDLPKLWRDENRLTLSKAVELLTPIRPPSSIVFGLGNSYNNERYTRAIKLLQAKFDMAQTGIYDEQMAAQLYKEKRHGYPKERGT